MHHFTVDDKSARLQAGDRLAGARLGAWAGPRDFAERDVMEYGGLPDQSALTPAKYGARSASLR